MFSNFIYFGHEIHYASDNYEGSEIAKQNTDDEQHAERTEICVHARQHNKYIQTFMKEFKGFSVSKINSETTFLL